VTGGTECARSNDGGQTWQSGGVIMPPKPDVGLANFLKLSLSPDGGTIYAYGGEISDNIEDQFGARPTQAVLCRSTDGGHTWSDPAHVPMPVDCPLEISFAALPLQSGRLLAPAGTLPAKDRLGEEVIVAISDDGGSSWPNHATVFHDAAGKLGYFEHKFAELPSGQVLAVAWTVTLGDYRDQENSFTLSDDGGTSWRPAQSTGIRGQTMTPIPLGDDRLLVLYNRRYGEQAIVMCLVTTADDGWTVHHEDILYDANTVRQRGADVKSGIDELDSFAFGFPTAIHLRDGTLLATHWSVENGTCGIRWTRLRVDW
jgi:hypothetical protein